MAKRIGPAKIMRTGTGQGNLRSRKFQGTAGYVIRISVGVGGGGRGASSYPDCHN
jgi:hypothetical protein